MMKGTNSQKKKANLRRLVLVFMVAMPVLLVVRLKKRRRKSGGFEHSKVLSEERVAALEACLEEGPCGMRYESCVNDTQCSMVMSSISTSLRERQKLPYLPRNSAMRALQKCADENCFVRECFPQKTDAAVYHHGCPSGSRCYLENDLVQTDSADACRDRCFKHAPPLYPESCAAWSWIKTPRIDDPHVRHTCFLIEKHKVGKGVHRRKGHVASGFCAGGPRPDDGIDEKSCTTMANDIMALRAWLKVKRHLTLSDTNLQDLFHFMNLTGGMCPTDSDFEDALSALLSASSSNKNKKNSLLDSLLTFLIDIVESLFDLLHKLNPALFIPLLIPLIAKLRSTFPKLASLLSPFLDHIEKQHSSQKKAKKNKHPLNNTIIDPAAAPGPHPEDEDDLRIVDSIQHHRIDDHSLTGRSAINDNNHGEEDDDDSYTIST